MTESNSNRIDRILEKLRIVRRKRLTCFGSEKHQFKLNPPLCEQEVTAFEEEKGITLPADFRLFLTKAGNGGAGPYYGIFPLNKWNDYFDWVTDDELPKNILTYNCPLTPEMNREEDWREQFDCLSPYQGTISIGTQGCTYMMILIVTGDYAGRVVYVDADEQSPYVSLEKDFLAWYERWLDELLRGGDLFLFGYGIGGDEKELLSKLSNPTTKQDELTEAVYALRRLPQIGVDSRSQILELLNSSREETQSAACAVVQKFKISGAAKRLRVLLRSHVPKVQRAALRASLALGVWEEIVQELLHSQNIEVAEAAYYGLKERSKLGRDALIELAEHSAHESLRYSAAYTVRWNTADEEILLRLLKDECETVRFSAICGLKKPSTTAVAEVLKLLRIEDKPMNIGACLLALGRQNRKEIVVESLETLLQWTKCDDDFNRLDAFDSLCKLGDERAISVSEKLLEEKKSPRRFTPSGGHSNSRSIRTLAIESLGRSPNRKLRRISRVNQKGLTISWFRQVFDR